MSQPNEFPEQLVSNIRAVLQQREYLYLTTRRISVRRRGKGTARIYTVYIDGTVVCDGPQQTINMGWRPITHRAIHSHKFPTVHEALKFVQTGVVLKLYGDNVPEYFTRR